MHALVLVVDFAFHGLGRPTPFRGPGNRLLLLLADELVGWRMPNGIIARGIGGGGGGVVDGGCPDEGDCM